MPDTLPPLPDPAAEGARKITTAIEKNRGLTPHRNKAGKNPRKKNRTKFEKAKVRPGVVLQLVLLCFSMVCVSKSAASCCQVVDLTGPA